MRNIPGFSGGFILRTAVCVSQRMRGICVCDVEMYTPPSEVPRSERDHPLPSSASAHPHNSAHVRADRRPFCCRARGALRGDVWILSWGVCRALLRADVIACVRGDFECN